MAEIAGLQPPYDLNVHLTSEQSDRADDAFLILRWTATLTKVGYMYHQESIRLSEVFELWGIPHVYRYSYNGRLSLCHPSRECSHSIDKRRLTLGIGPYMLFCLTSHGISFHSHSSLLVLKIHDRQALIGMEEATDSRTE